MTRKIIWWPFFSTTFPLFPTLSRLFPILFCISTSLWIILYIKVWKVNRTSWYTLLVFASWLVFICGMFSVEAVAGQTGWQIVSSKQKLLVLLTSKSNWRKVLDVGGLTLYCLSMKQTYNFIWGGGGSLVIICSWVYWESISWLATKSAIFFSICTASGLGGSSSPILM